MSYIVHVTFLDTETDEIRQGELVNPFRVIDGRGICIGGSDAAAVPEKVTVLTLSADAEFRFYEVHAQHVSAYNLMNV